MNKCPSNYQIARISLTLLCVTFFVLQTYQEMEKFFSNMTSVSTKTVKNANVRFPTIVVCLDEPFKSNKQYPKSLEDFYNITYTIEEVFYTLPDDLEVTSIATFFSGMCYLLKRAKESDINHYWLEFRIAKDIRTYFVDKGQELCLVYGLMNCNAHIEPTLSKGYGNDIVVAAKRHIRVPGYGQQRK